VLNPLAAIAYGATLVATITAATISIDKLGDAFGDSDKQANKLLETTKAIGNFQMSTGTVLDLGAINRNVDTIYLKKAAAAKAKADKAAAAAKIAADKKAAANATKLAKAKSIFDLDRIQIEAALKGKISEEEKIRLLLLQAIADEDADKAETLSKKLEEIQKKNEAIAKSLMEIGQAKDPFSTWSTSLTAALLELNKVGERMFAIRQRESGFVDTSILGGGGGNTGGGAAAGGTTFPVGATPAEIIAIVETAVVAAETAAIEAAASIEATQTNTEALAASAEAAVTLATELSVAADIADQAQSSSIFNPYGGMNNQTIAAAKAAELIAAGSNAGAGTSSSMFNPYATTPGSSAGFGIQNPVSIIVNNNGSVIMQDQFVDAVNDALLASQRFGYGRTPAGFIAA
jgi:hypothetical protein